MLREDILKIIDEVFKGGILISGPKLEEFEKKFSKYINSKYGIGVGNCTDALYIALKACKIGKGDEVLTVSNTAIATITAIVDSGADVKFVDINKYSLIDVDKIHQAITKKTKAIVQVHLFGQVCEMNKISGKTMNIKHNYCRERQFDVPRTRVAGDLFLSP